MEIDVETEKTALFKPALEKMYFATTSTRSTEIDEYVREKSEENISKGLFSIHVFFWEDIVELIDQNKATHDWYVDGQDYQQKYSVCLLFDNGKPDAFVSPKFDRYVINYYKPSDLDLIDIKQFEKEINAIPAPLGMKLPSMKTKEDLIRFFNTNREIDNDEEYLDPQPIRYKQDLGLSEYIEKKESACIVRLSLKNTGSTALTEIKVVLGFEGTLNCDSVNKNQAFFDLYKYDYNVSFSEFNVGVAEARVLVPGDTLKIDDICFMTVPEAKTCSINWKLYSKDYQTSGELKIEVSPEIEVHETDNYIDNPPSFTSEMVGCHVVFVGYTK